MLSAKACMLLLKLLPPPKAQEAHVDPNSKQNRQTGEASPISSAGGTGAGFGSMSKSAVARSACSSCLLLPCSSARKLSSRQYTSEPGWFSIAVITTFLSFRSSGAANFSEIARLFCFSRALVIAAEREVIFFK